MRWPASFAQSSSRQRTRAERANRISRCVWPSKQLAAGSTGAHTDNGLSRAISQIPQHGRFHLGRNLESGRRLQTQHGIPPPSNVVLEPRTPACRPEVRLDIDSPQGAKTDSSGRRQ